MPTNRGLKIVLGIVLVILTIAVFCLYRENISLADQIQNVKQENQQKIAAEQKKSQEDYVKSSGDKITGSLEITSNLSAQDINTQILNVQNMTANKGAMQEFSAAAITSDNLNIKTGGSISCNNCIALGITTTGNYVKGIIAGTDINIIGSGTEGSLPTIYDISTLQSVTDRGASTTNALAINALGDTLTINGDGTIHIVQSAGPATTIDRLYNVGGNLVWNEVNISGAGPMPIGSSGQTMRHNGVNWVASSLLFNNGTNIGIGDTSPLALLTVGSGDLFQVDTSGAIAAAAGITSSGAITFSGLTPGSVLFSGAGGLLSQNNANFYWDNANARLGIGTAPSYKLHIVDSSTTASTSALYVSQTGAITGTGYAGYFSKTGTSTTNVGLYVTASGATNNYGLIVATGNVGIGITTPNNNSKLQIQGQYNSIQYTTTTTLDWANGNVQYIQLANGAQTFTFANPQGGARYMIMLKQPSSGAAGTVSWPGNVLWSSATAPTLTLSNSKTDIITFVYDSTNSVYYGSYTLNY